MQKKSTNRKSTASRRKKDQLEQSNLNLNNQSLRSLVRPISDEQKLMIETIDSSIVTFVVGPAGTGKTILSVCYAVDLLLRNKISKILFTRPVVEAGGEKLGFLPGNIQHKIDPYMAPIFEYLSEAVDQKELRKLLEPHHSTNIFSATHSIRTLPLAYMRGATFRDCLIVSDESQNMTKEQMRMLLTRIGKNSRIIVNGDLDQSDLGKRNGLADAVIRLKDIKGVSVVTLTKKSIVRHKIIAEIEECYRDK